MCRRGIPCLPFSSMWSSTGQSANIRPRTSMQCADYCMFPGRGLGVGLLYVSCFFCQLPILGNPQQAGTRAPRHSTLPSRLQQVLVTLSPHALASTRHAAAVHWQSGTHPARGIYSSTLTPNCSSDCEIASRQRYACTRRKNTMITALGLAHVFPHPPPTERAEQG